MRHSRPLNRRSAPPGDPARVSGDRDHCPTTGCDHAVVRNAGVFVTAISRPDSTRKEGEDHRMFAWRRSHAPAAFRSGTGQLFVQWDVGPDLSFPFVARRTRRSRERVSVLLPRFSPPSRVPLPHSSSVLLFSAPFSAPPRAASACAGVHDRTSAKGWRIAADASRANLPLQARAWYSDRPPRGVSTVAASPQVIIRGASRMKITAHPNCMIHSSGGGDHKAVVVSRVADHRGAGIRCCAAGLVNCLT